MQPKCKDDWLNSMDARLPVGGTEQISYDDASCAVAWSAALAQVNLILKQHRDDIFNYSQRVGTSIRERKQADSMLKLLASLQIECDNVR